MRATSELREVDFLLRSVRHHPPFDAGTEREVARRARRGDRQARQLLVIHNLGLVASTAAQFAGHGLRMGDLVQEGTCGLIKAVDRFDPERGFRFSTYAVWWIKSSLFRACARERAWAGSDRAAKPGRSLDETIPGSETTHLDELVDESPSAEEFAQRKERWQGVRDALERLRPGMGDVAWAVITTRLSEYDPQTLRQIGNRWGLSHERIRQIERVTRARLAAHLAPLDEAA